MRSKNGLKWLSACGHSAADRRRQRKRPGAGASGQALVGRLNSAFPIKRLCLWRWSRSRSGWIPDRDDQTPPHAGVKAAIIFLIHVRGDVALHDDRTEVVSHQAAQGDLALPLVTCNRCGQIGRAEGNRTDRPFADTLVAVRSTFRKSGLQPFAPNGAGHGDICGLLVT